MDPEQLKPVFSVTLKDHDWNIVEMAMIVQLGKEDDTVIEIKRQLEQSRQEYEWAKNVTGDGIFPPLKEDNDLVTGKFICDKCGQRFKVGDLTTFIEEQPATREDVDRASKGQQYNVKAKVVHASCNKGIRLTRMD